MAREIKQRQRDKGNRKTKFVILFGVEGKNQTERLYFNNYQKRENPFNIHFTKGRYTDPVNIVNNTINYMKSNDISIEYGDKIYCVFDGDYNENGKDKQTEIDEAYKLAKENGIEIIMSTPSFELWLLLHFEYTTHAFVSNDEVIKYLKKHISDYDKNKDIYTNLKNLTDDAINNAKKLKLHFGIKEKDNISNNKYNPTTDVYKVVEYIRNKQRE